MVNLPGEIVGVGLRGTPPELNSVMLDGVRTAAAIALVIPLGTMASYWWLGAGAAGIDPVVAQGVTRLR